MKELYSNGFALSIAQAIEEMKAEQGDSFSLDRINLAELERRSGVSRGKLRRLKRNGFQDLPRSTKGRKHANTKLSGYTDMTVMDGVRVPVERSAALMKWNMIGEVLVPGVLKAGDINSTDGCAKAAALADMI